MYNYSSLISENYYKEWTESSHVLVMLAYTVPVLEG